VLLICDLDGVMVRVFSVRPKGRGFKPGRYDGFSRATKIQSTAFFGGEVKSEAPCQCDRDATSAKLKDICRKLPASLLDVSVASRAH
jgi:hypothetical protein